MKRFVIKLFVVMVPFVVLFAILSCVAYTTELGLLKKVLTFPVVIRAAIVGDSRVEQYFDPEEIPWLKNCGQGGTPFEITAQKAKLIAELNPNLELIVIDIWPDKFFAGNEPFGPFCPDGASLIELMTRENMPPLGDNFALRFSQGMLKPGLKHVLKYAVWKDSAPVSRITGGFVKNHRFLKNSKWAKPETYANRPVVELRTIPPKGERVLEDLLKWMREHKRKVILTSTPLYDLWWKNYYSEEAKTYFERRMTEIAKKYGVHWYNWLHEYQDKIDFWADGDHLNDIGAKQFSRDKRPILESELAAIR